jgi:hypothetical protein
MVGFKGSTQEKWSSEIFPFRLKKIALISEHLRRSGFHLQGTDVQFWQPFYTALYTGAGNLCPEINVHSYFLGCPKISFVRAETSATLRAPPSWIQPAQSQCGVDDMHHSLAELATIARKFTAARALRRSSIATAASMSPTPVGLPNTSEYARRKLFTSSVP